jgi:signal transduction histidine kinase
MIAALILAIAAALAATAIALRQRRARHEAERRVADFEAQAIRKAEVYRNVLPVAAHELRSPISIVLGYQELLSDGLYGQLDVKGVEALTRVRDSAEQLLRLIDGMVELGGASAAHTLELAPTDLESALSDALTAAEGYAQAYAVQLESHRQGPLPTIHADDERVRRALDMTLAAAIKASPGQHLTITATPDNDGLLLAIAGTGLEPERDDSPSAPGTMPIIRTGAGLRLAIARRALEPSHGSLQLDGDESGVRVRLQVFGRRRRSD